MLPVSTVIITVLRGMLINDLQQSEKLSIKPATFNVSDCLMHLYNFGFNPVYLQCLPIIMLNVPLTEKDALLRRLPESVKVSGGVAGSQHHRRLLVSDGMLW